MTFPPFDPGDGVGDGLNVGNGVGKEGMGLYEETNPQSPREESLVTISKIVSWVKHFLSLVSFHFFVTTRTGPADSIVNKTVEVKKRHRWKTDRRRCAYARFIVYITGVPAQNQNPKAIESYQDNGRETPNYSDV